MSLATVAVLFEEWHETGGAPRGYVGGAWIDADSAERFDVTDPATGETIATVPRMGRAETCRAVRAAEEAWVSWRTRPARERAAILLDWRDCVLAAEDSLAELMVREQGKPLREAVTEIRYAASFLEWFAEEAKRAYGETIPGDAAQTRVTVQRQPIGVGAAITPWNFPAAMVTRKAGPALAAGCTLVLKPAEQTPLSAIALVALAEQAGVPAGVLNLVTGDAADAPEIGAELTENEDVRKVSFTGSTEVGRLLMRQAATTVKSLSLELGGNAPFIVFDDADLVAAVDGLVQCKYRNAGQTCISANRVLVARSVYDQFIALLTDRVRELNVGSGLDDATDVGPLIDRPALTKVIEHVADAERRGAKVVLGGQPHELGGTFFQPTIVRDVPATAQAFHEETFGPVAFLHPFDDEDEAIRLANDTPYGLAAYFYAQDVDRVWRVSEGLESGMVGINQPMLSTATAPFGGVKQSGLGREGSRHGLDDWLEMKYICQVIKPGSTDGDR
ncbi:NAD-dependent succinate-semialdehyde dehydrogenase [Aeromicrobium piscarium]|uniref:NAD-dependent succinate-semialdehyde dehydrogenase n=1 Tax=Aeromicrobium piscarium TaxID=2590901 RepID=A0A554RMD7_9ACTN|nr:NAD-dependent succinate-semialdehyde dehydrogenase [Aeromicrobium piscarium]TSD55286.1 NAD-dependent succinate-semialdehyde dehydrogenase [Aeromicrobium piscarium]